MLHQHNGRKITEILEHTCEDLPFCSEGNDGLVKSLYRKKITISLAMG